MLFGLVPITTYTFMYHIFHWLAKKERLYQNKIKNVSLHKCSSFRFGCYTMKKVITFKMA